MKNKIIYTAALSLLAVSCTKNFEDFNTDKKSPIAVPAETVFTNAQKELVDQVSSTSVNLNVFKLFAQYWTTTTYTDEANYDIVTRTIPDSKFRIYYRDILADFAESKRLILGVEALSDVETMNQKNKVAIINILEVYTYQRLVDIFGNIPYSEALDIENISPKYDDALTIYKDLLARLETATSDINLDGEGFGDADIYLHGDLAAWLRFANSLKVKVAINLSDVEPALAQSTIEGAVADGVMASMADEVTINYLGATPNTNPLYVDLVLSGRQDFIPANTIVDMMNGLEDPRSNDYFELFNDSIYLGAPYGLNSPYANFSHISDAMHTATFRGMILTYSELCFYLAEAAERGMSVGGTAIEFYNKGVTASILEWGGSDDEATAYLLKDDVNYLTAKGDWKEKIGNQAWIAAYTRGLVGFTSWRRLDFPILNVAPSLNSYDEIPKRFTYPVNEQTLNAASYAEAAAAIGGDQLTTKLFWDAQ